MLIEESYEEKLRKNEKQLKELVGKFESLSEEINSFFEGMGTTTENVTIFLGKAENFDKEAWEKMELERNKLNEKLHRELANIRDTKKLKKKYQERHEIASHWLFVR